MLDDCSSTYFAGFVQDDWRVTPQLTLNLGLRYELDTDVKNISGYGDINPIVQPFLQGDRKRDMRQLRAAARLRLDQPGAARSSVHGGFGIYYDRVTLEIISLERGLDGRALPIEVRAGNVFFLDPRPAACRPSPPPSPTRSPASSCPGAGASGINIIDNSLENPTVQQWNLGTRFKLPGDSVLQLDLVHNRGTHFIIGRPIGTVFNPVVGGPDRVREPGVERRHALRRAAREPREALGPRAAAAALLQPGRGPQLRERRPDPVRRGPDRPERPRARVRPDAQRAAPPARARRARFMLPGRAAALRHLDARLRRADGHPDARRLDARAHAFSATRAAGEFETAAELNAYLTTLNARAGSTACRCRSWATTRASATASTRSTCGCRARFALSAQLSLEAIVECFNVFNVTNILGVSKHQLLGLRERAGARQLRPVRSRLPALVLVRPRADDGRRRLRLGRAARLPARPEAQF